MSKRKEIVIDSYAEGTDELNDQVNSLRGDNWLSNVRRNSHTGSNIHQQLQRGEGDDNSHKSSQISNRKPLQSMSAKSSSFLTVQKEDSSQVVVNEKYNQNVQKSEDCIHIKEPLLKLKPKQLPKKQPDFLKRVANVFCSPKVQTTPRSIYINGDVFPENYEYNLQSTTKYRIATFLPRFFYHQLSQFPCIYYVIIAISQFFYELKVGSLYTYLTPAALLFCLLLIREGYDDIKRYLADQETDKQEFRILNRKYEFDNLHSGDIRVGQIVFLEKGEKAPADLILLYSSHPSGEVLVKMDKLNGKTNHVVRSALELSQKEAFTEGKDALSIADLDAFVEIPPPSSNLSQFEGNFELRQGYNKQNEQISLLNTIWANSVLATDNILGLVIYTGRERRCSMGIRVPTQKVGKVDSEASRLTQLFLIVIIVYAILIVVIQGNIVSSSQIFIDFIRYFILLSSIVPVTLRINLELVKMFSSSKINSDESLAKNIPEELGRVQILLADKTGTLTKNEMTFKKIVQESACYSAEENMMEMVSIVITQCMRHSEPMSNYLLDGEELIQVPSTRRSKEEIFRDLITAISVCHGVYPVDKSLEAESQDEVALVKFSGQAGMQLLSRDANKMVIEVCRDRKDEFDILDYFPFNSETKKMGIIVRHVSSTKIILYMKGASAEMRDNLSESAREFLDKESTNISNEGLRGIVFAQKLLTNQSYLQWKNRDKNLLSTNESNLGYLEADMEFLGITCIEDELREDTYLTIESVILAGIAVWIATGDNMEQAISTAIRSGVKKSDQHFHLVKNVHDDIDIKAKLEYIHNDRNSKVQILVIDGQSLSVAIQVAEKQFIEVCTRAASVIFCRCTPQQKTQIVELVKKHTILRIAAIGDGVNDVGMIQSAHLGIGIASAESNIASLAADVSIPEIHYLNSLLLWHGRMSSKRADSVVSFVLQRGLMIAFIELIFVGVFFTIQIQIFNAQLLFCYASIFTLFPIFTLVLNSDLDFDKCMQFPQLYKSALRGKSLNLQAFFSWAWKSIYQSTALMLLIFKWFSRDYFLNIETFVFFALIFSEYLQILVKLPSIKKLQKLQIALLVLSLIMYLMILLFLQPEFGIADIWTFRNISIILAIVAISWAPLFSINLLRKRIEPTDDENILKTAIRTSSEAFSD